MKIDHTIIVLVASLILVACSGLFVLNDNNKSKTYEGSETQIREMPSEGESLKGFSGGSEGIIQKVEMQDAPLELHGYWDLFETVIIDLEEFENAAANGNMNFRLLQKDFEIEIDEISRLNGGKSYRYSGHIKGIPQSKATFYVCGTLFSGSIEFEDLTYNIAVTSSKHNGETVHAVFVTNWEKDKERLGLSLNPLKYFAFKQDTKSGDAIESRSLEQLYDNLVSFPDYYASIETEPAEGIKVCREM